METNVTTVLTERENKRLAEIYRTQMQSSLRRHPPFGVSADEIEAHFKGMPLRYWERVDEEKLILDLQLVHKFLRQVTDVESPVFRPVFDCKHCSQRGFTEVVLCTWDRQGLLAKAASALSAIGANILSSQAFTRADNVVLDVFRVCDAEQKPLRDAERLQQMLFLLEGALCEPPRFASFWALSGHKHQPRPEPGIVNILFDNECSPDHTIMVIETTDRLGLLSDILQALAEARLNVAQALIDTDDDLALDTFYINELDGSKLTDPTALNALRECLTTAIKG